MPLKTRGRDDEIAGSGIFPVDSGVMQKNAAILGETRRMVSFHCSGNQEPAPFAVYTCNSPQITSPIMGLTKARMIVPPTKIIIR